MIRSMNYYTREVYGKRLMYPACEHSKQYLKNLGLKTFTEASIKVLEDLGIELHRTFEP